MKTYSSWFFVSTGSTNFFSNFLIFNSNEVLCFRTINMKKKSTLALEQTAAQKLVVWWRENRDLALCITLSTTTTTIEAATMELSKTKTRKYRIAKAN